MPEPPTTPLIDLAVGRAEESTHPCAASSCGSPRWRMGWRFACLWLGRRELPGSPRDYSSRRISAGSGNTVVRMGSFETPTDLTFNRGLIADPSEFARKNNAAAWLF